MDSAFARTLSGKISPVTTLQMLCLAFLQHRTVYNTMNRGQDLPSNGAPGRCEKEDVNANEGDSRLLCCDVVDDDIS